MVPRQFTSFVHDMWKNYESSIELAYWHVQNAFYYFEHEMSVW